MKIAGRQLPMGLCGRWMIGLVLLGFAVYIILPGDGIQFINVLPLLVLLACPLMHIFMHRKHGGKCTHHEGTGGKDEPHE